MSPASPERDRRASDSDNDVIVTPAKGSKRLRSASIQPSDVSPTTNEIAAPSSSAASNPSPSRRHRKDPAAVAAEQAEKKRKQEEKAALKAVKDQERAAKKEAAEAAKKIRQEEAAAKKAAKEAENTVKAEKRRWKQNWESYWKDNDLAGETVDWPLGDERPLSITQSDAKQLYKLDPKELGCLRHCREENMKHKHIMKLFEEDEVKILAFRKYAMLAGVPEDDELAMLQRGKVLWEEEERRGPGKLIFSANGTMDLDHDQGGDPNWWRDPR